MTPPNLSVDTLSEVDLRQLGARWPGVQNVRLTAALFEPDPLPMKRAAWVQQLALADPAPLPELKLSPEQLDQVTRLRTRQTTGEGFGFREGPQWRIEISPGVIAVRRSDLAKLERSANRDADDHHLVGAGPLEGPHHEVGSCYHPSCGELRLARGWETMPELEREKRRIVGWSRKSRSRMLERLGSLDYTPMLQGARPPVLMTLTYSNDWLRVVPNGEAAFRHFAAFRKRFARKFGQPMVGVWKREFQGRGAPHLHILLRVPDCSLAELQQWSSETWADVVNHPDPDERARHELAGTGIDVAKGAQMSDPRRVGVYFSKHGSYRAKDYQNNAPDIWIGGLQPRCEHDCDHESCHVGGGTIGRFWGVLGLEVATATVPLTPREALHAARVLARWHRANRHMKLMPGQALIGEETFVHKRRDPTMVPHGHMGTLGPLRVRPLLKQRAGYLLVNDAPALAGQLARQLDQWSGRGTSACGPSGAAPRGLLP